MYIKALFYTESKAASVVTTDQCVNQLKPVSSSLLSDKTTIWISPLLSTLQHITNQAALFLLAVVSRYILIK